MSMGSQGGEMKGMRAERVTSASRDDEGAIRDLTDAMHTFNLAEVFLGEQRAERESLRDLEKRYSGEAGGMFTLKDDAGKIIGFLSLTKAEGKATIDHIRAAGNDPHIIEELLKKAREHLMNKGIRTVEARVSDRNGETEHALHALDFHRTGEESGLRVYEAHL
ncbi:MAG: hypothetical protein JO019_02530 [Candidatus Kaiserbacteria bacterium]|nr:hypothetical protein [Candidatus Kaiserbacteria bacterium]